MSSRLIRAERRDFTGLWEDMLKSHNFHLVREAVVNMICTAREAGTEQKRRIRPARRLASKDHYAKAAQSPAHVATLDPASSDFQQNLRSLHLPQEAPVYAIPDLHLPLKPFTDPKGVRIALLAMNKDSSACPGRSGVRWLLLVAKNVLRICSEHCVLKLLPLSS